MAVVVVALFEQVVVGAAAACSELATDPHHWELETVSPSSSGQCRPRQHLARKEVVTNESVQEDTNLGDVDHERRRGPRTVAETEPCSEPPDQDPDAGISLERSGTRRTLEYKPAPGTLSDSS